MTYPCFSARVGLSSLGCGGTTAEGHMMARSTHLLNSTTCNGDHKNPSVLSLTCDTIHNTGWETSLVEGLNHVQG